MKKKAVLLGWLVFASIPLIAQVNFQKGTNVSAVSSSFGMGNDADSVRARGVPSLKEEGKNGEPKATLNFNQADIQSVIRSVSYFVKKDFLVEPNVHGTINLVSNGPVSRDEAYDILMAALRMQGFTVVEGPRLVKIMAEPNARGSVPVVGSLSHIPENQMVTKLIRLSNAPVSQVVQAVRSLTSSHGVLTTYPVANTIVVSDYKNNLEQILKVVNQLDQENQDLGRVFLRNYTAYDMLSLVQPFIDPKSQGVPVDIGQRVTAVADRDNNSIILYGGTSAYRKRVVKIIQSIDMKVAQSSYYHIVYLKYADANYLANTLRSVLSRSSLKGKETPSSPTGTHSFSPENKSLERRTARSSSLPPVKPTGASAGHSSSSLGEDTLVDSGGGPESVEPIVLPGITIAADESINALVVYAPQEVYRSIRSLIEQLDIRRAQLFIESLIVEVSSGLSNEIGIQFQNASGAPFFSTNFNQSRSIFDLSKNFSSIGSGLVVGLLKGTVSIGGMQILDLSVLANFLETQTKTNILSKPNILTLDNQEARIVVGDNVPFVTAEYQQTSSGGAPFRTFDRQDVGLTLSIRPQIMKDGVVKLDIYQEVSSVRPKAYTDSTAAGDIITSKRSIRSTVLVNDGQIVALGGLIEEKLTNEAQRVPFLGRIPILGALFRSNKRAHDKTNLIVFLRPVIIRDMDDMNPYTINRYNYLRVLQKEQGDESSRQVGMPFMKEPLLPPLSSAYQFKRLTQKHPDCDPEENYTLLFSSRRDCTRSFV